VTHPSPTPLGRPPSAQAARPLSLRGGSPNLGARVCVWCGKRLVRREGERPYIFRKRKGCNRSHARKAYIKKRRAGVVTVQDVARSRRRQGIVGASHRVSLDPRPVYTPGQVIWARVGDSDQRGEVLKHTPGERCVTVRFDRPVFERGERVGVISAAVILGVED